MKKFLSLVLALVMTMSLVTISAGAKDFTDDSKLNYKEAVDVISAVKVVDGYADGSFNPQATLTRGAAAKIICNLILSPTTASALVADAAPFKDVPVDSTFAGYIAFCAKEGIISGYADGTFKPGNSLTGYAFMKMLLGALGYDKSIEGYDGANWSINVAKRALNIGLDDGLVEDFNGIKPVTREEACLYAFNTLTADMVDYDNRTTVSVGGAEVVIAGSKAEPVENYAAASKHYDGKADGKMQFCEKYFSSLKLDDTNKVDVFGRPANTWYKKNDKIGTYAKTADVSYTTDVKAETIYKDLDLSKNYNFAIVVDGVDETNEFWAIKKDILAQAADDKIDDIVTVSPVGVGNGSQVEVYEDEGIITVINTYLMQVSGDYDTKNEELTLAELGTLNYPVIAVADLTLSSDDFAGLDEYKDEDYVVVTVAGGEIQSIAPAEKVTATVTDYVHMESVTAGGEKYEYAVANNDTDKVYTLKEDADLYLDANGYVLYAKAVSAKDAYAFITEFATSSNLTTNSKVVAYAYFTDGTEEEIVVSKVNGSKVNGTNVAALHTAAYENDWYTFVEKDGKYELTQKTTVEADPYVGIVTDYSQQHAAINGVGKEGNKSTIFVVLKPNGDVVTYEGIKNVPDITAAGASAVYAYCKTSNYATVVFVKLGTGSTIRGGSTSSDIVFLLKNEKQGNDTDDDEYYRYKALVNGEEKKVYVEKKVGTDTLAGMLYTNVEYTSKGYVTALDDVVTVGMSASALNRKDYTYQLGIAGGDNVEQKDNTVIIDGVDYFMADSYKIFVITGSDVETQTMKQLARYDAAAGSDVFGVMNSDGEYTALYIYHA